MDLSTGAWTSAPAGPVTQLPETQSLQLLLLREGLRQAQPAGETQPNTHRWEHHETSLHSACHNKNHNIVIVIKMYFIFYNQYHLHLHMEPQSSVVHFTFLFYCSKFCFHFTISLLVTMVLSPITATLSQPISSQTEAWMSCDCAYLTANHWSPLFVWGTLSPLIIFLMI